MTESQVGKSGVPPGDQAIVIILGLVLFLASLLMSGYSMYRVNQMLQIPLVELCRDPSLYAGDPFAATLIYYITPVWRVVAWISLWIPLKYLLFSLFLIERSLLLFAAACLARSFAGRSLLAQVGAMAFFALMPSPIFGDGTLVTHYFEQTGLSIPFFLLAMAAFYQRRYPLWAVWLSIGFTINSMYGAYALTYFAVSILLNRQYIREWRQWLPSCFVFLALSSPMIVISMLTMRGSAGNDHLWVTACRLHFPEHFFPMTWGWAPFAWFAVLGLLLLAVARQYKRDGSRLFGHAAAWTLVAVLWLAYAFVASFGRSPNLMMPQPARGADLWCCFAAVALISAPAVRLEGNPLNFISLTILMASILVWQPFNPNLMLAGLVFVLVGAMWQRVIGNGNARHAAFFLVLFVLVMGFGNYRSRAANRAGESAFFYGPESPVREIADWARTNTQKTDTFLIDPRWGEFRALSLRPVVVTWEDGSAIGWDRGYVSEWARRLRDLGLDIRQQKLLGKDMNAELGNLYSRINDNKAAALGRSYSARYWVVPSRHSTAFRTVFQDAGYKVVLIPESHSLR